MPNPYRGLVLAALLLPAAGLAAEDKLPQPTGDRLIQAAQEPRNWLTYFGTYNGWRHSTLDQINTSNVKKLVPAWAFQTGKIEGGLNATPLVMDGVLFLTGSYNRIFALDAVTGDQLWNYFYKLPQGSIPYTNSVRGLAIGHGLVFIGTGDNHLVALDQKTGREVWNVEIEDVRQCGCNITAAPLVIKDKVIAGVTGGDGGHRGYLNAFDPRTRRHVWRFFTIPGPGEPGFETWESEAWKLGGGATWMVGTYDPEQNLILWGVGNPSSDFDGSVRPGDNLYTDSLVALDADTGKLKWHYQEIPHDEYDFDAAYEPVLIERLVDGRMRKLVVHPSKAGFTWVVDRTNGKFINAWKYVDNINWVKSIDKDGKLIGRLKLEAGKENMICPHWGGARSWNHSSYSPRTGWLYNIGIENCGTIRQFPQEGREGRGWVAGVVSYTNNLDGGKPYGHLDAWDPVTGERKWTVRTRFPILSSLLTTGGDLMFTGDVEGRFLAFDARTGQQLWSFQTGSGHRGSAIAYSVNGRQYIAVPAGLGSIYIGGLYRQFPETRIQQPGSTLFVFALPEEK